MGPALLLHPSVDKFGTKIQAAHRIPDQVGGRIGALVIGVGRLELRVLHLHKTERRIRSYGRGPVMLITAIGCKEGSARSDRFVADMGAASRPRAAVSPTYRAIPWP